MKEKHERHSPDKNFKLTFFDSIEPRMGMNMCKFSLVDLQTNEEINFAPLWAVGYNGYSTSWSEDSNYFALPVCSPSDCFFIYDLAKNQFASIHFSNVWELEVQFKQNNIEIEFNDSLIPDHHEHQKYPTKHYLKPENLVCPLAELNWTAIKSLQQFEELGKGAAIIDLKPIDNGWRQFKGELPQTTELLVRELIQFAKYGDKQSIEWFEEIQALTKDINYWTDASQYLGIRQRNGDSTTRNKWLNAARMWIKKFFG